MFLRDVEVSTPGETIALDREGRADAAAPAYWNAAVRGETALSARELFAAVLAIETEMGRDPAEKSRYLPRVIDIDILFLEDEGRAVAIRDEDLVVPHPRLTQRSFLLEPLARWGLDYERIVAAR